MADPLEALHLPDQAEQPDPAFAERLRRRIEAELVPDLPPPAERRAVRPGRATTTGAAGARTDRSTPMTATEPELATANAVVPYLAVHDAAAAIDFYREVFGLEETIRFTGDDGRIGHADLAGSGIHLMLADEHPDMDVLGPLARGGAGLALHVSVPDVDATYASALAHGATALRPPADQPYGDRSGDFIDPYGHRWMVSTPISAPSLDELNEAMPDFTVVGTGREAEPGPSGPEPIEVGYLTFGMGDTTRSAAFFGQLFGWEVEPGNAGEGYVHVANTRLPMGMTPDGPDGRPTVYFRVPALEPFAAKVVELGGRVVDRNEYPSGGDVVCVDDQGNEFHLWSPAPGY